MSYFQQKDHPYLTAKLNNLELQCDLSLMLFLLLKDISFESENIIVHYVGIIVTIFLQIYIPLMCIKKYLARTKLVKRILDFTSRISFKKSISRFNKKMLIELNEYKTNLGRKSLNSLESQKSLVFSSNIQEGLLQIMTQENKRLKEKISEIVKENDELKVKNAELSKLLDISQCCAEFSDSNMLHKNLEKNDGDQLAPSLEELYTKELTWNYSKKNIIVEMSDFHITFNKDSCLKEIGGKINLVDKEIKKINFEIENTSIVDLKDLKIKCKFYDGNCEFFYFLN